ncbi:MAG: hypothetical protein JKX76_01525 [Colwellia sp.]|nr:hypothetical protein [Colwellia sp.]
MSLHNLKLLPTSTQGASMVRNITSLLDVSAGPFCGLYGGAKLGLLLGTYTGNYFDCKRLKFKFDDWAVSLICSNYNHYILNWGGGLPKPDTAHKEICIYKTGIPVFTSLLGAIGSISGGYTGYRAGKYSLSFGLMIFALSTAFAMKYPWKLLRAFVNDQVIASTELKKDHMGLSGSTMCTSGHIPDDMQHVLNAGHIPDKVECDSTGIYLLTFSKENIGNDPDITGLDPIVGSAQDLPDNEYKESPGLLGPGDT